MDTDGVVASPAAVTGISFFSSTTGVTPVMVAAEVVASLAGEPPATEIEVLVEIGDPGNVGASVTSVTAEDEIVESACCVPITEVMSLSRGTASSCSSTPSSSTFSSTGSVTGTDFDGDGGGVRTSKAFDTISSGGRARGEIIIPGAFEGSPGRRDQIAMDAYEGGEEGL